MHLPAALLVSGFADDGGGWWTKLWEAEGLYAQQQSPGSPSPVRSSSRPASLLLHAHGCALDRNDVVVVHADLPVPLRVPTKGSPGRPAHGLAVALDRASRCLLRLGGSRDRDVLHDAALLSLDDMTWTPLRAATGAMSDVPSPTAPLSPAPTGKAREGLLCLCWRVYATDETRRRPQHRGSALALARAIR